MKNMLTLGNPLVFDILLSCISLFAFIIYISIFSSNCDISYIANFIIFNIYVTIFFTFLAYKLQNLKSVNIYISPLFNIVVIIIVLFVFFDVLSNGVNSLDSRFDSFSSSFIANLHRLVGLFLPLLLFTNSSLLKKISCFIIILYISYTLYFIPSKSDIFIFFIMFLEYRFLKNISGTQKYNDLHINFNSIFILFIIFLVQVVFFFLLSTGSLFDKISYLIFRIANSYDIFLHSCNVSTLSEIPNHPVIYSFMSIIKRINLNDVSYYYDSVPQWVIHKALGIDPLFRKGFPNDNIFVAYFLFYKEYSFVIMFLLTIFFFFILFIIYKLITRNFFLSYNILKISPLFIFSTQDFFGLVYFILLLSLLNIPFKSVRQ